MSPAHVNLPYHARPADVIPQAPKSNWGACRFVLPLKLKRRAGPPEPKRLFAPVPKKPRAAPDHPHQRGEAAMESTLGCRTMSPCRHLCSRLKARYKCQ